MLSLLALGVAGAIVGGGTFASFSAITSSGSNTFSTAGINFQDAIGVNLCTSTLGGTASGTGCSTAVGTFTSMIPGEQQFGTVKLTNQTSSTATVTVALGIADAGGSNGLTNTGSGAVGSASSTVGLGLLVFECTNSAGTVDEDCTTTDATGKLQLVYGSCGGTTSFTPQHYLGTPPVLTNGLPVGTITFTTSGVTDNGVKVGSGATSCYGGNGSTGLDGLSSVSIVASSGTPTVAGVNSLGIGKTDSLTMLVYLPATSDSTKANITNSNLTYTWTASQLAGSAH